MHPTVTILLVGSITATSCALIGTFLVLRKMALLGDAISHAVLPGIVIAFLWTGSRAPIPMVLGAGAFGLLTVVLIELFHRTRRLKKDASIGVVFPALFSVGVVLISRYAGSVDLDLDCVLYGEIAYAPLDLLFIGEESIGPKALWVNGLILLLNLLFVGSLYKELKISTFDPALAATLGLSPLLLHYLLMASVSVTVVGAFESVGAILVLAMLVVPPATAYLLTDRLPNMLALSVGIGVASAWIGYFLARWWDASIAGAIALASGLLFLLALLLSRRHGLLARALRHRRLELRLNEQFVLLHLQDDGAAVSLASLGRRFAWPARRLDRTVRRLRRRGWIDVRDSALTLTAAGVAALEQSGRSTLRHPPSAPVGGGPETVSDY